MTSSGPDAAPPPTGLLPAEALPSLCRGPADAWDVLYDFGGAQLNVAEAAPGDTDYNGGRWQVHALVFPSGYALRLPTGTWMVTA